MKGSLSIESPVASPEDSQLGEWLAALTIVAAWAMVVIAQVLKS